MPQDIINECAESPRPRSTQKEYVQDKERFAIAVGIDTMHQTVLDGIDEIDALKRDIRRINTEHVTESDRISMALYRLTEDICHQHGTTPKANKGERRALMMVAHELRKIREPTEAENRYFVDLLEGKATLDDDADL